MNIIIIIIYVAHACQAGIISTRISNDVFCFVLFLSGLIVVSIIVGVTLLHFASVNIMQCAFACFLYFALSIYFFHSLHNSHFMYGIFLQNSLECHRLRECIIVETVKSLTERDTIYIYGFSQCHATVDFGA